MTILLTCPKCNHEAVYEERNIDNSKEITCSVCGFSDLPTTYSLARNEENKSWQIVKIIIIILAGLAFVFVGLSIIVMAAFYVPIILVAVIIILLYSRWKENKR
jgi:hypothetical protein